MKRSKQRGHPIYRGVNAWAPNYREYLSMAKETSDEIKPVIKSLQQKRVNMTISHSYAVRRPL